MTVPLIHETGGDPWEEMQPGLDEALASLSGSDRELILLRYYRALTIPQMAGLLGIGTEAAQKRVTRATDRLRVQLSRRGCQAGGSLAGVLLAGLPADAQAALPLAPLLASKALATAAATTTGSGLLSSITGFLTSAGLKTSSGVVPAVLLLAGGIWLASQLHSMAGLERQNALLKKHLATTNPVAAHPAKRQSPKTALDRKPVDWEEVARQLGGATGWNPLQANLPLIAALEAMGEEELVASLDEIAAARLSTQARATLDNKLGELLVNMNPERGLTRFIRRCNDSEWDWTLGRWFEAWAVKDPDKAIAWFASQLAAGVFNGKGPDGGLNVHREITSGAIFSLISSNPEAAGRLLSTLPENLRRRSLGSIRLTQLKEADHTAWMSLVRNHLPASDRNDVITWPTMNWSDGDGAPMTLVETSDYLSRIGATREETAACVMCVAGQVHSWQPFFRKGPKTPAEGIADLRAWITREAPALLDPATAKALGALAEGTGHGDMYPEAVKLALHYRGTGGSDALLTAVLDSSNADGHRDLARGLAGHLADAAQRENYLKQFSPREER